ncbi:MAG TPA: DUF6178 family protein [Candidatus Binataceae bacterium]|nr:DUF6178 family protein [Candidatus Binataceae bacterium]
MAVRGQDEFLNLPFQEKLEFLYGLPARQKRDLILAAPEAERLVQSFSPETLFYTVKEIGSADAGDLLSLALPEQVKSLFDLDCWDKDRPNLARMREWLEALSEGGRSRMAQGLMELDLELVSILLRDYIKVHLLDDPASSPDAPSNRYVQFDEHYLIEFVRQDHITQLISDFIEEAFERDYKYFAGLMDECYWGVKAELEEAAYQFRRARLNDRGFPDYYEAQDVFAYVNPRSFLDIRAQYVAPSRAELLDDSELVPPGSAPMIAGADNSLLNTALTAGFAAEGRRQLRSEMAMVSNQVLVARSIDFGDLDAVRIAVELTHNYLNLGLESLAGGDLQSAIEHLRDTHLKLLFRLGVSLTIDLRKRAEATTRMLGIPQQRPREISYLDSPYRDALAGFIEPMPRFYSALDRGGAVELRAFQTIRDLHLSYAILDQIDAMAELFRSLLAIDISSARFRGAVANRDIRLSQILTTALVRNFMDGRLQAEPLVASELDAMRAAIVIKNGGPSVLSHAFRESVETAIDTHLDETAAKRTFDFVNSCLNQLEEEFAGLSVNYPIDSRFIESVLVKRSV